MCEPTQGFLRRSLLTGLLGLIVSATVGCGGKGTISGKVTVDGQPLGAGVITFHPSKGQAISADIKDGQYTVTGVHAGDAKVTVSTAAVLEKLKQAELAQQNTARGQGQMAQMTEAEKANLPPAAKERIEQQEQRIVQAKKDLADLKEKYRPVPDKYTKPESTPLTAPVKSGHNTYDVSLTSQ